MDAKVEKEEEKQQQQQRRRQEQQQHIWHLEWLNGADETTLA